MLRTFMVFLAVLFISCSEDTGLTPDGNTLGLGSFEVKIDGDKWIATDNFVFAAVSTSDSISSALVTAAKSITTVNSESFGIIFSNALTGADLEATYSLGVTSGASLAYVKSSGDSSISYIAFDGQIVVSEITDTNIKGTFNAVCKNQFDDNNTLTMTDGKFNAVRTN